MNAKQTEKDNERVKEEETETPPEPTATVKWRWGSGTRRKSRRSKFSWGRCRLWDCRRRRIGKHSGLFISAQSSASPTSASFSDEASSTALINEGERRRRRNGRRWFRHGGGGRVESCESEAGREMRAGSGGSTSTATRSKAPAAIRMNILIKPDREKVNKITQYMSRHMEERM